MKAKITTELAEYVRSSKKHISVLSEELGLKQNIITRIRRGSLPRPAAPPIPPPADTEWRPVAGFEGQYLVSRDGRVWCIRINLLLRPSTHPQGYKLVGLWSPAEAKQRSHRVHRLVAQAFIPNPEGKPEVNHIDLDKANNRAENLEWATPHENSLHSAATGALKGRRLRDYTKGGNTKGRRWTDEQKARMSAGRRARWAADKAKQTPTPSPGEGT